MSEKTYTITVSQSQEPAVVHDRVHVLNPHSIYIAIENDPASFSLAWGLVLIAILVDLREKTICPVSTVRVQDAVEFIYCYHLWVHDIKFGRNTCFYLQ